MGGKYEPVGSLFFWVHSTNGDLHLAQLRFSNEDEVRQIMNFTKARGWKPFGGETDTGTISPLEIFAPPMAGKGDRVCPKHGAKYLKEDGKKRGEYCSARENNGFCGWQSWK